MTAPFAWLADTNVASGTMRSKPDPRVAACLDPIADDGQGLASVAVREGLDGIGRLPRGRHRRGLAVHFEDLRDELFEGRAAEWNLDDARAWARIMEDRRRRGEAPTDHVPDAFVAAAAATRGLAVVTRNPGGFRSPGVETVDPGTAGLHRTSLPTASGASGPASRPDTVRTVRDRGAWDRPGHGNGSA